MTFFEPTDISVTTTTKNGAIASGFYGSTGAYMKITLPAEAPYIYVGSSTTGTFWRKEVQWSAQNSSTLYIDNAIKIDQDTSSTSDKTFYAFGSSTDLGNPASSIPASTMMSQFSVPRFACMIYYFSSSPTICYWSSTSGTISPTSFGATAPSNIGVIMGYSSQSSWSGSLDSYFEFSTIYANKGTTHNGQTYYAYAYKGTSITYYQGSNDSNEVDCEKHWYGKGENTTLINGGEPYHMCASNNSYTWQGWATSNSTSYSYSTLAALASAGYTKAYGVYKKSGFTSTFYYYRGSSSKRSVKQTVSDAYYYYTGSHTGGTSSYGAMTTSCLSDNSYELQYWVTHPDYSSNNTPNAQYAVYAKDNPTMAFDDGYSTIYGVYQKENVIKSQTNNLTYYCGTNSPNTCTKTQKATGEYYGDEGNHIFVGDVTTTYSTVDSTCPVSGWEHIGWAYDSTTQYSTLKAENLFNSGYTTIYGTYKQTKTVTYYPQNGSTEGTSSIDDYRYGVGSVTNNIPQGPALTYDGYTFIGWATTEDGTADTWDNQCSNGARFLYAIWERDGNVYLGINDNGTKTWVLCDTYIGKKVNNVLQWVPMQMKVGANSNWN